MQWQRLLGLKKFCVCGIGRAKKKALTLPDVIISGNTEVLWKIRKENELMLTKLKAN